MRARTAQEFLQRWPTAAQPCELARRMGRSAGRGYRDLRRGGRELGRPRLSRDAKEQPAGHRRAPDPRSASHPSRPPADRGLCASPDGTRLGPGPGGLGLPRVAGPDRRPGSRRHRRGGSARLQRVTRAVRHASRAAAGAGRLSGLCLALAGRTELSQTDLHRIAAAVEAPRAVQRDDSTPTRSVSFSGSRRCDPSSCRSTGMTHAAAAVDPLSGGRAGVGPALPGRPPRRPDLSRHGERQRSRQLPQPDDLADRPGGHDRRLRRAAAGGGGLRLRRERIVFPAIVSLALFSTLFTLQRFAGDLYALLSRDDAERGQRPDPGPHRLRADAARDPGAGADLGRADRRPRRAVSSGSARASRSGRPGSRPPTSCSSR